MDVVGGNRRAIDGSNLRRISLAQRRFGQAAADAEVGLRYKVTDWASLNMKAEKDIISGTSDSDLDKTRYTVGFGVAW